MKHQMFNNNILTKDVTDNTTVSETGFIYKKESRYKELEVLICSVDGLEKGDVIKVRKTAGDKIEIPDGEFTVINIGDVIMKL